MLSIFAFISSVMGRKRKIELSSASDYRRMSDFFGIPPPAKCTKTTNDDDIGSSRSSEIEVVSTTVKNVEKRKISKATRAFRDEWKFSNPWLRYDSTSKKMFYSTCESSKVQNSFTTGCSVLKKESIDSHLSTKGTNSHKVAVEIMANSNDMVIAREKSINKSKDSVIAVMRNVLFMAEHDLPNSILKDLNNLCIEQGSAKLQALNVDKHTSYTHNNSVHDFQQALADTVLEELVNQVKNSDYFSILIDESTDVATDQNLIIYVRYLFKGNTKTEFLCIRKLNSGATAEKLFDVIIDVLDTLGLDITKMSGMATDGAAVMVGSKSGIVTRLKVLNPTILATHCIAHRLALGSCGAADQVPYLIKYQEIINCVYKYFENSPKNLNKLKHIQEIMSEGGTRFKQVSGTRWLSFEGAVHAILRNYSSLVSVLIDDKSAKTAGLLKSVTSVKFLYCTYFLSDVLGILCRLSKCYQKNDIMFSNVNPLLESSIDQLKNIHSGNYGPNFSKFQNLIPSDIVLDELGEASFIFEDQLIRDGFKQRGDALKSCNSFVLNVIENLKSRFEEKGDAVHLSNLCKIFDINRKFNIDNVTNYTNLLNMDPDSILEEILSFQNLVKCSELDDSSVTNVCKFALSHYDTFPNINQISKRLLTIPVATADCERGFSRQNIIKNNYRNCLKTNTLCNLMVLSMGKLNIDYDKAFKKWANAKNRRIL